MEQQSHKPSGVEIWRRYDAIERRLSTPLTNRMLELGNLSPGMKVLDIATGRGEPAIPAAKAIVPDGFVLGLDIDRSILELARERADREEIKNLELGVSNFETLDGISEHHFEVALARWGLMYFQNPVRALQIVRRALVSGGLLVAAVWTDPENATFFQLPRAAFAKFAAVPAIDHNQPGTFYYSDLTRLTRDLKSADFAVLHNETMTVEVMEVSSDDELIAWGRSFGMWDALNGMSAAEQSGWEQELVQLAEPYRTSKGTIRISGRTLIVVAEAN